MVSFKLVISDPKTGKSFQREVKEQSARPFIGLKVGATVKGEAFELAGYEFEITGGSDYCGFPMRKDVTGTGRKRILAVSGTGIKKGRKGMKQRKTVCGNTIHVKISQVNLKILKYGKEKLVSEPSEKKEAPKKEEKPKEEPKKEKKKPEPKKEEKPKKAPKKEEKPKEEKKPEPKKEEKPKK